MSLAVYSCALCCDLRIFVGKDSSYEAKERMDSNVRARAFIQKVFDVNLMMIQKGSPKTADKCIRRPSLTMCAL